MQYVFDTQGLRFYFNMENHIEATSTHFKSWYKQHNDWLPKFVELIKNQYKLYSELMIFTNFGDQVNFKEKMKRFSDAKVLDGRQLRSIEAKIDKSWAYTLSIHRTMETVPNYRDKFAKLLAPNYLRDFFNTLSGIFYHLSELDPKSVGKNILKYVQEKDSALSKQMEPMKMAAMKVMKPIADLSAKAYEFGLAFATMEESYHAFSDKKNISQPLIKQSFQQNFLVFSAKFDQFLELIDRTSNGAKELLKHEGQVLGPIFSAMFEQLEHFPAELLRVANI